MMTTFWSTYISLISIGCWLFVVGVLWLVTKKIKPTLDEDGTTGHEYDGIREYDKPMPHWWLIMFWGMILFAAVYVVFYPALGNHKALLGVELGGEMVPWSSHNELAVDLAENNRLFSENFNKNFAGKDLVTLSQDLKALKTGQNLFLQNCAVCHGSSAKGAAGFPNLTDSDWLHGGEPATIQTTITKGRHGEMPEWQSKLGEDGVEATAEFVLTQSESGRKQQPDAVLAAKGQAIFSENCALCHGPDAHGMHNTGAPNLTDNIWLWGGSRSTIRETIRHGRNGVMPSWQALLGDQRIELLSAYVYSLSQP